MTRVQPRPNPPITGARGIQRQRHGLTMTVQEDSDEPTLPEDQAVLRFQSVWELLFNVVDHAAATETRIAFAFTDEDRR